MLNKIFNIIVMKGVQPPKKQHTTIGNVINR